MIDSVLNLLFRCPHRRITRPITPVSKAGVAHGDTYVVCLDCGKQFVYDLQKMRIDKPVQSSEAAGVLHPNMPTPRTSKLKLAALASAVPLAWLLGSALKSSKKRESKPPSKPPT
jgi:hypothetical protein